MKKTFSLELLEDQQLSNIKGGLSGGTCGSLYCVGGNDDSPK